MRRKLLSYFGFCLIFAGSAAAETIYLKDGSHFEGSVLHFYDSTLQVALPSGDTLILTRAELARIVFQETGDEAKPTAAKRTDETADRIPPPESRYATPKKTIETWTAALKKGDWQAMADCFIHEARAQMLEKLRDIPEQQREQMVKEARKTAFRIARPRLEGEYANVTLTRKLGKSSTEEVLRLQRVDNEWRLIPN